VLITFLWGNLNVFAWKISDMSGIPREVIEHKLSIDPSYKPVKQKERRYKPERHEIIGQEVNKLLEIGFIRPVDYPSYLANPIFLENPDGSWHIGIDYTCLNKACPKYKYPLSRICQIADFTSCELFSFLDAYLGYHQISLVIDDEEKTVFITPFGIFYYTKMAFGLKNEGATYQKGIQIILETQIERNVKAYIDDVVVNSKKHGDLFDDLTETFDNLHKYKMMLNPKKYIFGVSSGNYSAILYQLKGSTQIQQRLKPSQNCNHHEPKERSRSWQV
jgi:hypothetical protein